MTRNIIGFSAFYHESAAALTVGGDILAAVEEERFSRRKHDASFPRESLGYCLDVLRDRPLDAVVYYDRTPRTLDRILRTAAAFYPDTQLEWQNAAHSLARRQMRSEEMVRRLVGDTCTYLTVDHHLAHAASAFYPSPFERAACLVIDGVGEWATTSLGVGAGATIDLLREVRFPHSLGLLYSAFTHYCGFKVNSGEYKLMGLAPFGRPRFVDTIFENLLDLRDDGSFGLNLKYFGFHTSPRIISPAFETLFGRPARRPETRIDPHFADVAASIQVCLEEAICRLARTAVRLAETDALCLAGGVALNCVANGRLLREGICKRLWVQPAAGDAGGALGAALMAAHGHFGLPRPVPAGGRDRQHGSYLGPGWDDHTVVAALADYGLDHRPLPKADDERFEEVAEHLDRGAVVATCLGRMEFGPRALGNRSILADPRRPDVQRQLNVKVKFRESWRPFAPMVLAEMSRDYFELEHDSPYMLLTAPVRRELRLEPPPLEGDDLIAVVNQPRSTIPAVTHVDFTSRIQTVTREDAPAAHALLSAFHRLTGCPVLVNTSFNIRGEPIVCTPYEAIRCFLATGIDVLVFDDRIVVKAEQDPSRLPAIPGEPHALD